MKQRADSTWEMRGLFRKAHLSTCPVNIPPVPDLPCDNLQNVILNLIDDAIDSLAQPIPFTSGEFFASREGAGARLAH